MRVAVCCKADLYLVGVDLANKKVLDFFLATRARLWIDVFIERPLLDLVEGLVATENCVRLGGFPACVTIGEHFVEATVFNDFGCGEESTGAEIGSAHVRVDQVFRRKALTAHLGVEVTAALIQPARLYDVNHAAGHGPEVIRGLIGVPAEKWIAAIDVKGTENSERASGGDFMLKGMACKQSMISL